MGGGAESPLSYSFVGSDVLHFVAPSPVSCLYVANVWVGGMCPGKYSGELWWVWQEKKSCHHLSM